MSVEKVPHVGANGASTKTKSDGAVKGGHGPAGAGDSGGQATGFGALLFSLRVDDADITVDSDVVSLQAQDPLQTDPNAGSNHVATFIPTIQVAPSVVVPLNVDVPGKDAVLTANALLTAHDAQSLTSGGVVADSVKGDAHTLPVSPGTLGMQNRMAAMNRDELGNEIVPAVPKFGVAEVVANTSAVLKPSAISRGQFGMAEVPDALGPSSATAKLAKSLKERGRAEVATSAMTALAPNAVVVDSAKIEVRGVIDKADVVGRVAALTVAEVISQEPAQQMEFRREKAVFKPNSTTTSPDVSVASGVEAQPNGLSLEGMTADMGAGLSQGDDNPGTYWMSSDLKNAEMKLDGFGESVVEVSISVHGNQTHVAFRSDEEQTRLALGDAGATLKDMLHKEGLDLTGVSVGTSNAGEDAGQERRSRQENRPGAIEKLANNLPSGTSGKIVPSRIGQLDVFV